MKCTMKSIKVSEQSCSPRFLTKMDTVKHNAKTQACQIRDDVSVGVVE